VCLALLLPELLLQQLLPLTPLLLTVLLLVLLPQDLGSAVVQGQMQLQRCYLALKLLHAPCARCSPVAAAGSGAAALLETGHGAAAASVLAAQVAAEAAAVDLR
jgi:hypothetical protein